MQTLAWDMVVHNAASRGNVTMAAMLISQGCDLQKTYKNWKTRLKCSRFRDRADKPKMVELLLQHGVESFDERRILTSIVGQKKHSLEMIKLLHQHGTDYTKCYLNEYTGEKINA